MIRWLYSLVSLAWLDEVCRHGVQGAFLSVWMLGELMASQGGTHFSARCTLMPLLCWGPDYVAEAREVSKPKKYAVIRMAFYGKGRGKKVCACHLDYQLRGATLHRVRLQDYPTCDSDLEPEPNQWRDAGEYVAERSSPSGVHWGALSIGEWTGKTDEVVYGGGNGFFVMSWPYTITELHQGDRFRWHCTDSQEEKP